MSAPHEQLDPVLKDIPESPNGRDEEDSEDPTAAEKSREVLLHQILTDDIETLGRIIDDYKAHQIDFTVLPRRPRFKPPRVNSGITCNAEIRRRALERAKTDPDGTGGSLSSLIELLLWKFLGCPQDVVEQGSIRNNDQR